MPPPSEYASVVNGTEARSEFSCLPLAELVRTAAGGYRLETLWPVGQFRWSTHVELVARFVR